MYSCQDFYLSCLVPQVVSISKRATEIVFARRGTNLPFIQELLYYFGSRSDSFKILCAQTGNKKRNEKFSKTSIFELI